MSRACASCGAIVPDGEEFCDNCGTPVYPETSRGPDSQVDDAPITERAAGAAPGSPPPPPAVPEVSFRDPRVDAAPNAAAPASPVPPAPAPPAQVSRAAARGGGRFIGLVSLGVVLVLLLGAGGWLLLSGRDNAPEALQAPSPGGSEAGQAAEEEPSGGESTEVPEMTLAADPALEVDYTSVQEGALTMEIPADWQVQTGPESEGSGTSWSQVLGIAEVSITAAPDLGAWHDSGDVTGMYAVASRALTGYTNEQIITTGPNDLSSLCTLGDANDFAKDAYSARIQTWSDCGGNPDSKSYTVAITPQDGGCAVALRIGTIGEGGLEMAQHIMDTLAVDCSTLPEAAAPEESITPSEVPAEEYVPPEQPTGNSEQTTGGYTPPPEGTTPR